MAIWQVELDRRDSERYRKQLFTAASSRQAIFPPTALTQKMRKMANEGKLDAVRCIIGSSVRWYYAEEQAELAHLAGKIC